MVFFACVYLERAVDLLEQNGAKHLMRKGELGKRHQFEGAAPHSFRKSERPAYEEADAALAGCGKCAEVAGEFGRAVLSPPRIHQLEIGRASCRERV